MSESESKVIDSVHLLVRDYGSSTRNDQLNWLLKNMLVTPNSSQILDDNMLLLHCKTDDGSLHGLSHINDESVLLDVGSGPLYKEQNSHLPRSSSRPNLGTLGDPESSNVTYSSLNSFLTFNASTQDDSSTSEVQNSSFLHSSNLPGKIGVSTHLTVIACKYRIVFTVDCSPSMVSIDPITGEVLFDQIFGVIEKMLVGLVKPLEFGSVVLRPHLYVSIILQGSSASTFKSLFHGLFVSSDNIKQTLTKISIKLKNAETDMANAQKSHLYGETNGSSNLRFNSNSNINNQNQNQSLNSSNPNSSATGDSNNDIASIPVVDLGSLLKNSMFVLKMLPLDACPILIVLTDGVTMLPEECEQYDSLLMLMNREDIICHVVEIGSGFHDFSSFGFVSDCDSLQNFVSLTRGHYFNSQYLDAELDFANIEDYTRPSSPFVEQSGQVLAEELSRSRRLLRFNELQSKILFRNPVSDGLFNMMIKDFASMTTETSNETNLDHPYPYEGFPPTQKLYPLPFRQYPLIGINIFHLLDCRYREGFSISKFSVSKRPNQSADSSTTDVSIKLTLPWKDHIWLVYAIKCQLHNDIPNLTPEMTISIDALAYYDLISQYSKVQKQHLASSPVYNAKNNPSSNTSPLLLVHKMQHFLSSVVDTDKQLSYLIKHTLPLNEVIGRSLHSPLHQQIEKTFWKVFSNLPKNVWHRWFKMDRLELVLSPDLLTKGSTTSSMNTPHTNRIELKKKNDSVHESIGPQFKFDVSTRELLSYFENWTCFSPSKHSFARVIENTVVVGASTNQIANLTTALSQLSSPTPTMSSEVDSSTNSLALLNQAATHDLRVLSVPSFCVVRLTWASKNTSIINFYFFATSPQDRFKIINSIKTDLQQKINPNDPTLKLFTICSKPLRYALVRYQTQILTEELNSKLSHLYGTENTPSLLNNALPAMLKPIPPILNPSRLTLGSISGNHSSSSTQLINDKTSFHKSRESIEPSFSPDAIHLTDDPHLKILASFLPPYHLLSQFMHNKRWIWAIYSEATQEVILESIIKSRLNEGFQILTNEPEIIPTPTNNQPRSSIPIFTFCKEIQLFISSADELDTSLASDLPTQSCIIQYLVYSTRQGHVVTELWMEPLNGLVWNGAENRWTANVFDYLKSLIYEVDLHLISTLATFDTLSLLHNPHTTRDILAVETEIREYKLESSSMHDVTVQKPPFNLKGIASLAIKHEEYFHSFEKGDNVPLHACLQTSISHLCDRQLPNSGPFELGQSQSPIWTKSIVNSNDFLMVVLHPLLKSKSISLSSSKSSATSATQSPTTSLSASNATSKREIIDSKSSSPRYAYYDDRLSGTDQHMNQNSPQSTRDCSETQEAINTCEPLHITVYQCSRVVEAPILATQRLRQLLLTINSIDSDMPATNLSSDAPVCPPIYQLCENLQLEHHRAFTKSMFVNLTNGKGKNLTQKDFSYGVEICQEYVMEMELTQFFRILSRWQDPNSGFIQKESSSKKNDSRSNSYSSSAGSDLSSPLEQIGCSQLDTPALFDKILSLSFQKVPGSDNYFFFQPRTTESRFTDHEKDSTSSVEEGIDESVEAHCYALRDAEEEEESHDPEDDEYSLSSWLDDLSKRGRSAAPIIATTSANVKMEKESKEKDAACHQQALQVWRTFPFFLRMECVFIPKSGSVESDTNNTVSFGLGNTSEGFLSPNTNPSHFPISTLPTPKSYPVMQNLVNTQNKSFLRFYSVVLPKPGAVSPSSSPGGDYLLLNSPGSLLDGNSPLTFGKESVLHRVSSFMGPYSKLPSAYKRVLENLNRSIRSIVAQQTLEILRMKTPVTRVVTDIVAHNMRQLNPQAYIVSKVPLFFIEPSPGITMFLQEFEQASLVPVKSAGGPLFFAIKPNLSDSSNPEGYSIPYWLFLAATPSHVQIRFQSTPGLLSASEKSSILESTKQSILHVCKRVNQILLLQQLYDARVCNVLLIPDSTASSPPQTKKSGSKPVPIQSPSPRAKPTYHDSEGIFEEDFYEAPSTPLPSSKPAKVNSQSRTTSAFHSGQFACPCVHEIKIPLNWRSDPKTMLSAISGTVLHHFAISNRPKMFVYREQSGKIFYMKLLVTVDEDLNEQDIDNLNSDKIDSNKSSGRLRNSREGKESSKDEGSNYTHLSASNSTSTRKPKSEDVQQSFLVLRVYGVDQPSQEITVQLLSLLESKINYFTLQVISTMLLRNPLMKLKPADDLFLRPPEVAPRRFQIALPSFITDINLFRNFLKNNLIKTGLTPLHLESVYGESGLSSGVVKGGRTPESESVLSEPAILHQVDSKSNLMLGKDKDTGSNDIGNTYLYNNMSSGPSQQPKNLINVGNGLAAIGVLVSVPASYGLDKNSLSDSHNNIFEYQSIEESPMHELFLKVVSSNEVRDDANQPNDHNLDGVTSVDIKIWTKGSLDIQKLIENLEKVVNQSLAEYQFEWFGFIFESTEFQSASTPHNSFKGSSFSINSDRQEQMSDIGHHISDSERLLEHATKLDAPCIRSLYIPISVPSWAITTYLSDIMQSIKDVNSEFNPQLFYSERKKTVQHPNCDSQNLQHQLHHENRNPFYHNNPILHHSDSINWVPYHIDKNAEQRSSVLVDPSSNLFERTKRSFCILATKASVIQPWAPKSATFRGGRENLTSTSVLTSTPLPSGSNDITPMRSFAIIFLQYNHLQLYAYNWNNNLLESLTQLLVKETNWTNLRQHLLNNILHQKMGLFHHAPVMTEYSISGQSNPSSYHPMPSNFGVSGLGSLTRVPLSIPVPVVPPSASSTSSTSPHVSSTAPQSIQTQTSPNLQPHQHTSSNFQTVQVASSLVKFSFENLDYLARNQSSTKHSKDVESNNRSKEYKRWKISANNKINELKIDHLLKRLAPLYPLPFKVDPVFRHAIQFKSIAQRYLKFNQVQQTLLFVYNQWHRSGMAQSRKKPGNTNLTKPSSSSPKPNEKKPPTASNSTEEKGYIDSSQLATVIKCARLLHSVKIPFFLTDLFIKEDLFDYTPPQVSTPPGTNLASDPAISASFQSAVIGEPSSISTPSITRPEAFFESIKSSSNNTSHPVSPNQEKPLSPSSRPVTPSNTGTSSSAGITTQGVLSRPEQNLKIDVNGLLDTDRIEIQREKQTQWRRQYLTSFMDEYTRYLETFGVSKVKLKQDKLSDQVREENKHDSASQEQMSKDSVKEESGELWCPKQTRHLQKVFRGGLILLQLEGGGQGNLFISCNLFILFFNRLTVYFGANEESFAPNPKTLRHLANFTRECTNIKTQLHLNSFVYDFHIRQLSHYFANQTTKNPVQAESAALPASQKSTKPSVASLMIPPAVEAINLLQSLVLYYENPPKHSRTQIGTSNFSIEAQDSMLSPFELFAYCSKNATKYNLFNTQEKGLSPGLSLVSADHSMKMVSADVQLDDQSDETYTLIAFMSNPTGPQTHLDPKWYTLQPTSRLEYSFNSCYNVAKKKHLSHSKIYQSLPSTLNPSASFGNSSFLQAIATPPPADHSIRIASPAVPAQTVASVQPSSHMLVSSSLHPPSSLISRATIPAKSETLNFMPTSSNAVSPIPSAASSFSTTSPMPMLGQLRSERGSLVNALVSKSICVSYFILRVPKQITFPLMASAYATPPPTNLSAATDPSTDLKEAIGPPTSLAGYYRRNMHEALESSRVILTDSIRNAILHSERDVLWTRLSNEANSTAVPSLPSHSLNSNFLSSEQLRTLLKHAYHRQIEDVDRSLASLTQGITTDWKFVMAELSATYLCFKTKFFLLDERPNLLLFNPHDSDLLLHLSLSESRKVTIHAVRRELVESTNKRHSSLEAKHVSALVNSICHILWKQLIPRNVKDVRR